MSTTNGHHKAKSSTQASTADLLAQSNLTRSQFLMWLGQQLNADAPLYNMIQTFTIHSELDVVAFRQAFQAVVDGSDALRTVITTENGVPQQQVQKTLPEPVELVDFSAEPDPDAAYQTWLSTRKTRLLALDEQLFDTALVRLAPNRYIWYLCQHHLITDGVSFALVYQHVADSYALARNGRLTQPPALPTYADYVAHERAFRETDKFAEALAYWQGKTATAVPPTDFYGSTARGASARTDRIAVDLGADRSTALRAIAQKDGFASFSADMSHFTIFATLLLATLHRISGQRTLRLGTPFHGRATAAFKQTIGLFIEIGPLQVAIDDDETFVSLGEKVMGDTFAGLMQAQPGISSADTNRAYDVLLNYVNASFNDFAGLPVTTDWVHSGYGDSSHNLRLQITDFDTTGSFVLHFDVNTAVFSDTESQWLIDHFLRVTDAFIADHTQSLGSFDLLSTDQRQQLLVDFNATDAAYPTNQTVVQLFEAQTARTPGAIAAQRGHETITYAQLNGRANQLAHYLQANDVGPETAVALILPRSIEALVAIWGVLKAGAAYVPIDPTYPADRISYMLEDASPKKILMINDLRLKTPALQSLIINLQSLDLIDFPKTNPAPAATPDNLVYMIYTSGSTGQPKGTMLRHQGLVNYVWWAKEVYQAGGVRDFPLYSSLAFDLTVTSIFVPLLSGGKIVVYSEEDHTRGLEILAVFRDDLVDVVKLTPAHLALVQETAVSPNRIRTLIVGGEDFKTDLARSVHKRFNGRVAIYNEYGPTEAVVGCMIHQYDPAQDTAVSVPIGAPAANARIYLLDEYAQPVPPGVVGEMVISSDSVARGYHNRPDLTAERFGADPFRPGARIYRTGDIARWHAGQMVFLGRRDHQVKIRGARIELGEIEAALLNHPQVKTAVVDIIQYQRATSETAVPCVRCGLPANYPEADIDADGVCADCRAYDRYAAEVERYFRIPAQLRALLGDVQTTKADADYDCMVLLSGGKDSTYMLYQIVQEYGMRPLVFSLDNGFISEEALDNVRRVCADLNVDLKIATTPHMNAIFADSLRRHSNVCDGCFKTIYTLSMSLARAKGIDTIITGLARGQLFETRLADTFRARLFDPDTIDDWILNARKAYHQIDDAVNQLLDVSAFTHGRIFDEIQFVDYYRYTDVDLDDVYDFLHTKTVWQRPSDTGRSTNCLINDAGIYIHKKERGYHNYALPYSWDVRLGHKNREMAMYELDDDIDVEEVRRMLAEIGYDENEKAAQRSEKRLAAYFVADSELSADGGLSATDLRSYLSQKLPEYMLPSTFTRLDALPLTTNGKVDRSALPDPDAARPDLNTAYAAPTDAREEALAAIWSDIFRLPQIGIHDNFFDLGGDSIISIQIVARARQAGLHFEPRQLFDHQTIAELATVLTDSSRVDAEQGLVTGPAPLTPIQHWFFTQDFAEPQHWNQSLWLDVAADVDVAALTAAWQQMPAHHDALRLRFARTASGWQQTFSAEPTAVPTTTLNLADQPLTRQDHIMQTEAAKLAAGLDLENGPLLRVALFQRGSDRPARLFITIHHLAIDGVSWRPLLEDVESAYNQIRRGQPVALPPKSSSVRQWSEKLAAWAQSATAVATLPYWQQIPVAPVPGLHDGRNLSADAHTVAVKLNTADTRALLHDVAAADTTINDALLTALAQTFAANGGVTVAVEGHGREEAVVGGVDLSRTVGWFTSHHPVHLPAVAADPGAALEAVKTRLAGVPHAGLSVGALRHLHPEAPLSGPAPSLLFNYLGQFERSLPPSDLFALVRQLQADISPRNRRTHALEINAAVQRDQLHVDWTFSPQQLPIANAQALAQTFITSLRALIAHCQTLETAVDPSTNPAADFDLVDLDADQFDRLAQMLNG